MPMRTEIFRSMTRNGPELTLVHEGYLYLILRNGQQIARYAAGDAGLKYASLHYLGLIELHAGSARTTKRGQ